MGTEMAKQSNLHLLITVLGAPSCLCGKVHYGGNNLTFYWLCAVKYTCFTLTNL
jgi:hypothetical protein